MSREKQNERRSRGLNEGRDYSYYRADGRTIYVTNWTTGSTYTLTKDADAITCDCPDFTERCQAEGARCKHIWAASFYRDKIIPLPAKLALPDPAAVAIGRDSKRFAEVFG